MTQFLCNESYTVFAAKHYHNTVVDPDEFHEDLDRVKYIKRLLNKYRTTGDLKERLIINHLVILFNVFDSEAITAMLFYKLEGYHEYLKPFLVWLSHCPDEIGPYTKKKPILSTAEIPMDNTIVQVLRGLTRNG